MAELSQINSQIPAKLARRIRTDVAKMGVTLSKYSEAVYEAFLSKNLASRCVHFQGKRRKTVGRPVSEN